MATSEQRKIIEVRLEVTVLDLSRKVMSEAKVEITTEDSRNKTQAKFKKASGTYEATFKSPGRYRISVNAEGLESQEREAALTSGATQELFILGSKGMPAYYRGRVKVPFKSVSGLIAINTNQRLNKEIAEEVEKLAGGLGAKVLDRTKALDEENTLLLQASSGEQAQKRVIEGLSKHPLVKRVGAVVTREGNHVQYLTSDFVVKFHPHVARETVPQFAGRFKMDVVRHLPVAGNTFLLRSREPATLGLLNVLEELVRTGTVEYAEPNFAVTVEDLTVNPTDFLYPEQWHLPVAQLPDAWQALQDVDVNRTFGRPSVIVAVLDRGIQSQTVGGVTSAVHPDFQGTLTDGSSKVYGYYDFTLMQPNNDSPPNDHGMGCAGVSVARANNASTVAGVNEGVVGAAANCRAIGAIRPAGGTEVNYSDAFQWLAGFNPGWVADGVNYAMGTTFPAAINPGADIITNSYSWSAWPISGLMSDTIDRLTTYGRNGKGTLLFYASGNGNADLSTQAGLAAHPKTFAIGASSLANDGVTETFGTYSNTGSVLGSASGLLDVCAPSHDAYVSSSIVHNPPTNYGVISADLLNSGIMPGNPTAQTTLTASAAVGATTLTVASSAGFAAGQGLLIGAPGAAGTEAVQVSGAPPSATSINVTALVLAHANGSGVSGSAANYTNTFGGTSSATPLTAGIAALVLSAAPNLNWVEVRDILRSTATKIDPTNTNATNRWVDINGNNSSSAVYSGAFYSRRYGFGRVNAMAAVNAAITYGFTRDLVVRENLADTGAVPSSGAYWDSPDIWVRNTDPATDGAAALPANYASAPPHQAARAGQNNWIYVRLRNNGTTASLNYYVRVYITHYPGTEFVYPANFIPTNRPGQPVPSPLTTGTYLIGEVAGNALGTVTDTIVSVLWPSALVPPQTVTMGMTTVTWHPCLLAEVSPHDGPAPTGNHVWDNNNLAQKNITIDYDLSSGSGGDFAMGAVIGNTANPSRRIDLVVDRGKLPAAVKLYVEILDPALMKELTSGKPPGRDGGGLAFPEGGIVETECCGRRVTLHLKPGSRIEYEDSVERNAEEVNFIPGFLAGRPVLWISAAGKTRIPVPNGSMLRGIVLGGTAPKGTPRGSYEITVAQYDANGRRSGALSFELQVQQ